MSFEFDPEIERRLREAASRSNQDVADFARAALLRQLESMDTERKANREASLAREFAQAMSDPLFVADLDESMADFRHADFETAGALSRD